MITKWLLVYACSNANITSISSSSVTYSVILNLLPREAKCTQSAFYHDSPQLMVGGGILYGKHNVPSVQQPLPRPQDVRGGRSFAKRLGTVQQLCKRSLSSDSQDPEYLRPLPGHSDHHSSKVQSSQFLQKAHQKINSASYPPTSAAEGVRSTVSGVTGAARNLRWALYAWRICGRRSF